VSSGYRTRRWRCPFFRWDERFSVHCEGGCVSLPKEVFVGFINDFCDSEGGWEKCPVAKRLMHFYDTYQQDFHTENK
jgi:hypothetical protein